MMLSLRRFILVLDSVIISIVASFGNLTKEVGSIFLFTMDALRSTFHSPRRFDEVIKHIEFIGNKSLFIIALTALFTGLALSFQIYLGFSIVNATNLVGPTVALGITRELGPVLTGLIVSARAGGAMAARLGTMRVNEQIDALDVMGVNTKQFLVAPRIYAAVICMPLLTAVFDAVSIGSSYLLCTTMLNLDGAVFADRVQNIVAPRHFFEGLFKAAAFGLMFAVLCTYRGYNAKGGAKGVGDATNQGVVASMVMVIILNYFLANLIRIFYAFTGLE